ncbi:MAG: phosphatidylglycerol lysyltransferase domain-containing protein [Oscillospiraceae bacterium]|nr:phosphatidylglycerol lysyltransferase domain-containing protein [Oscillospiraceae bacterium]
MPEFNKLTLNDIEKTRDYFLYSTNKTCDNTAGGTIMWRDFFNTEFNIHNNTLILKVIIKYHGRMTAFPLPLGKDVCGSMLEVQKYCHDTKIPLVFCTVTKEEIQLIKQMFRHCNVMLYQEASWSDYIYNAADLITLAGRKYSGQRNHINRFNKLYDSYSFEVISESNLKEVRNFYTEYSTKSTKTSEIYTEERTKIFEVFDNYDLYGMLGGLIRVSGKVAAFSMGEICNDVLYVHTEKADIEYKGIYQIINNEFAKHYASDNINFINREEDEGDEGLRRSKESYHPCEILDKYIVEVM